jgi:hypothetical protein
MSLRESPNAIKFDLEGKRLFSNTVKACSAVDRTAWDVPIISIWKV